MSEEALKSILAAREERRFISLRDFFIGTQVNQPIIENLIKVGAFDSLGDREELIHELSRLTEAKIILGNGTKPLFPEIKTEPMVANVFRDLKSNILTERSLLSLNLSAHPLDFFLLGDDFTRMCDLVLIPTGKTIKIAGSVIRYQTPPTRNGNRVVYVIIEDGTGIADVTIFNDVQQKCGDVLFKEGWLIVEGKVQRRGPKALSIIAEEILALPKVLS
ncbi:Error-prone DNA polymerase [subsurface metagenome]